MHLFEEICFINMSIKKKNKTTILFLKYNAYSREPVVSCFFQKSPCVFLRKCIAFHLKEKNHSQKKCFRCPFFESSTFFLKMTRYRFKKIVFCLKKNAIEWKEMFHSPKKMAHPQRFHPLKPHIAREYRACLSYKHFLSNGL